MEINWNSFLPNQSFSYSIRLSGSDKLFNVRTISQISIGHGQGAGVTISNGKKEVMLCDVDYFLDWQDVNSLMGEVRGLLEATRSYNKPASMIIKSHKDQVKIDGILKLVASRTNQQGKNYESFEMVSYPYEGDSFQTIPEQSSPLHIARSVFSFHAVDNIKEYGNPHVLVSQEELDNPKESIPINMDIIL